MSNCLQTNNLRSPFWRWVLALPLKRYKHFFLTCRISALFTAVASTLISNYSGLNSGTLTCWPTLSTSGPPTPSQIMAFIVFVENNLFTKVTCDAGIIFILLRKDRVNNTYWKYHKNSHALSGVNVLLRLLCIIWFVEDC